MATAYVSMTGAHLPVLTTSASVSKPSGGGNGDVLYAFCSSNENAATWSVTQGAGGQWESATTPANGSALFRLMIQGTEPASWTFTRSNTTGDGAVTIIRLSGAGAHQTSAFTNGTGNLTLNGVTTTQNNTYLFAMVNATASGSATWGAPASMTERFDNTTYGNNAKAGGDELFATAGATGTRAWTTTATGATRGVLIAVSAPVEKSASDTSSVTVTETTSRNNFVSHSSVATGVSNVTVSSTGPSGDKLVAFCWANNTSATWTPPAAESGGTWLALPSNSGMGCAAFELSTNGNEPSSFVFSRSNSTSAAGVIIWRTTGYDTVPSVSFSNDTGTSVVVPEVTATDNNSLLVSIATRAVTGSDAWTAPSGMTERVDSFAPPQNIYFAGAEQVVNSGATGSKTWTHTGTGSNRAIMFVISPAGSIVTKSASDTSSISVSDSSAVQVGLSASDASAVSSSESSAMQVGVSASDISGTTIEDSSHVLKEIITDDTSSVSVDEGSSLLVDNYISSSDEGSLSLSDDSELASELSREDTSAVSLSETTAQFVDVSSGDGGSVSVADPVLEFVIQSDDDDIGNITIEESSELAIANDLTTTDEGIVSVSESTSIFVTVSSADVSAISTTETTGFTRELSGEDSGAVGISESVSQLVQITSNDISTMSLTEAVEIDITQYETLEKSATDAGVISLVDASRVVDVKESIHLCSTSEPIGRFESGNSNDTMVSGQRVVTQTLRGSAETNQHL